MGVVTGKGSLFIDGVEVGPTVTIDSVEVEKEGYTAIPFHFPTEISMSGVWCGGIDLARGTDMTVQMTVGRQNGKSTYFWDIIGDYYRRLAKSAKAEKRSKAIRKSSYRKTKSQRRRG